jgi:hypothetical protein
LILRPGQAAEGPIDAIGPIETPDDQILLVNGTIIAYELNGREWRRQGIFKPRPFPQE